ncbi:MAG TPA: divalent-cation tolerance protein CutA [Wenzhouxiangella sp.]
MSASDALFLAQTTCPNQERAGVLAEQLVKAHLAACVNIGPPSRSVYPWAGTIETAEEVVLTIKTSKAKIEALKAFISEHHGYDVPELLLIEVSDGLPAYLTWAKNWLDQD